MVVSKQKLNNCSGGELMENDFKVGRLIDFSGEERKRKKARTVKEQLKESSVERRDLEKNKSRKRKP